LFCHLNPLNLPKSPFRQKKVTKRNQDRKDIQHISFIRLDLAVVLLWLGQLSVDVPKFYFRSLFCHLNPLNLPKSPFRQRKFKHG
jgi:hypothetical protein